MVSNGSSNPYDGELDQVQVDKRIRREDRARGMFRAPFDDQYINEEFAAYPQGPWSWLKPVVLEVPGRKGATESLCICYCSISQQFEGTCPCGFVQRNAKTCLVCARSEH